MRTAVRAGSLAIAFLVAFLAPLADSRSAEITNGRFESGSLSGWTVFNTEPFSFPENPLAPGYSAAVGASSGYAPLQGSHSALLIAISYFNLIDHGLPCADDIWNALPLNGCTFPPISDPNTPAGGPALTNAFIDPLVGGHEGALIGQDFSARAGDRLSWEWELLRQRDSDPLFAMITNGITLVSLNVSSGGGSLISCPLDFVDPCSVSPVAPFDTPGPRSASLTVPQDGVWTAYFGVNQQDDNWFWTGMELDNVRLRRGVPEPSAIALLIIGLAGFAFAGRRKR